MNLSSLINKLVHRVGLHISRNRSTTVFPNFVDAESARVIRLVEGLTYLPVSGRFDTYQATLHAITHVPGDVVECGVWRGGASILMGEAMVAAGGVDRRLYLYDTFEGMTRPTDKDSRVTQNNSRGDFEKTARRFAKRLRRTHVDWTYAPIEDVKNNLKIGKFPQENIVIVKGPVQETIPTTVPDQISVLRLDTDWYESTMHEMEHLFPLLSPGGILIIDDYGWWAGARDAVDEYLHQHEIPMHLVQNSENGAAIGIKPPHLEGQRSNSGAGA
jgi:O-methyltransferase